MSRQLPPGDEEGREGRWPERPPAPPPAFWLSEEGRGGAGGPGGPYPPPEDEVDLGDVVEVLRRRRRTVLGTLAAVLLLAALWTFTRTPVWEASTLIRVEEEGPETGGPASEAGRLLLRLGPAGQLETEMRVATSRPILEEVVDRLGLALRVEDPPGVPLAFLLRGVEVEPTVPEARYRLRRTGPDAWRLERTEPDTLPALVLGVRAGEPVRLPGVRFTLLADSAVRASGLEPPARLELSTVVFPEAVDRLRGALSVSRPDPDAQLMSVRYEGTDRIRVLRVPDALADAFLARRTEVQKTEARSTVAFLEEQTARIEAQLEAAEEELQRFREEAQVVSLEAQAEEQVRRLAELQAERSRLVAERDALRNLSASLDAGAGAPEFRKLAAFPTFLSNQAVQDLLEQLNQLGTRLVEMRQRRSERHPDVIALRAQIDQLEDQLGAIGRNYLRALEDQIASIDAVLARFGSDLERIPGEEVQLVRLERRTELLAELHTLLQTRLKEAEISANVEDPSVRVVETAALPREPIAPKPLRNLALAGFLGMMAGVGLAFVREYTDRRIRSEEEVDRTLGLPVLTRVPKVAALNGKDGRRGGLVTARRGESLPAESYRTLRTNVRYTRSGRGARELLVTSPGARDGKSITASNLAVAFAQQGLATVLVDCDLRRSVQHEIFDVARVPGLSEHLVDGVPLEEALRPTEVDGLALLPAGSHPPNPAELLGSPAMERLLDALRERYAAIVVDTPPALVVTDASVLGTRVEGVLLVVRADRTDRDAAADTLEQLRRVGCDLLGVVFNDAPEGGRYGYRSGYYYGYYGPEDGDREGAAWKRLIPFLS